MARHPGPQLSPPGSARVTQFPDDVAISRSVIEVDLEHYILVPRRNDDAAVIGLVLQGVGVHPVVGEFELRAKGFAASAAGRAGALLVQESPGG